MKISFLRAKRLAVVALLKSEKRRRQEREAEAAFYSDEAPEQTVVADSSICPGCEHIDGYHPPEGEAWKTN